MKINLNKIKKSIIAGLILPASIATAQTVNYFGDLNPTGATDPLSVISLNGGFIFRGTFPAEGRELCFSDGTFSGTSVLADLNTGPGDSVPGSFAKFGNRYLFSANGVAGREPYITDGTATGTTILANLDGGSGNSDPLFLFELDGYYYFLATSSPGVRRLYRTGGALATTTLVGGLTPANNAVGALSEHISTIINGVGYFVANTTDEGTELFRSAGTVFDTYEVSTLDGGIGSSLCSYRIISYGNNIFFCGIGPSGSELYNYDTTLGTTTLVADINLAGSSSATLIDKIGSKLYFIATPDGGSLYLYVLDVLSNTVTQLTGPGTPAGNVANLISYAKFNDKLYFSASSSFGDELFVSDGTQSGTGLVKDINPTGSSSPTSLMAYGDALYFSAVVPEVGQELFKTNGTADGTQLVADIKPGAGSSEPINVGVALDKLWISAASTASDYEMFSISDLCSYDTAKTAPGQCGCGVAERDLNGDGVVGCGGVRLQVSQTKASLSALIYPTSGGATPAFRAERTNVSQKVSELVRYLKANRSSISMKRGKKLTNNIKRIESAQKTFKKANKKSSYKSAKKKLNSALNRLISEISASTI